MTTRWIHPALGALALIGLAGSAHAAWGHSDYAHAQAYRQLASFAAPREDTNLENSAFSPHNPVMIRAFDEDLIERSQFTTRKAKRPDRAASPARS